MLTLKPLLPLSHGLESATVVQPTVEPHDENLDIIHGLEGMLLSNDLTTLLDKHSGLSMMGAVLDHLPSVSNESGALIDVASAILAQGTDLQGTEDFVPGLEAMIGGPVAESKNGFTSKAKDIVALIMQKIRDLVKWLSSAFTSKGQEMEKTQLTLAPVREALSSIPAAEKVSVELPTFLAPLLDLGNWGSIKKFTSNISPMESMNPSDYSDPEDMVEKFVTHYLGQIREFSSASNGDVIILDKLHASKKLTFTVPSIKDDQIVKSSLETSSVDLTERTTVTSDASNILRILDTVSECLTAGIRQMSKADQVLERRQNATLSTDMSALDSGAINQCIAVEKLVMYDVLSQVTSSIRNVAAYIKRSV